MKPSQIRIEYAAALAALEVALSRLLAPWFDEVEIHTEGGATMLEVAREGENG